MAFDALSTPAPAEHPALTKQRLRQRLTRLIDRLVAALDEIDGDPDFEDGADDEPALSFQESRPWDDQAMIPICSPIGLDFDELEEACEDEGAEHDGREPELYS